MVEVLSKEEVKEGGYKQRKVKEVKGECRKSKER